MNFIKFLFTKYFLINIAIYVSLVAFGIWGVMASIDDYTLHGKTITVPDFRGYHTTELDQFLADKELTYLIVDSIFEEGALKGSIIDQKPEPGVQVKRGRKIYMTVNANSPKKIAFPSLTDVTLRQANALLETYGIIIDSLKYKPDECVNCVLGALIDIAEVEAGQMLPVGTRIILILGGGLSSEYISVPILINKNLIEIKKILQKLGLNMGAINYEDCETAMDTISSKVYRQLPDYQNQAKTQLGQSITLFFTGNSSRIPETIVDSTNHDIEEQ